MQFSLNQKAGGNAAAPGDEELQRLARNAATKQMAGEPQAPMSPGHSVTTAPAPALQAKSIPNLPVPTTGQAIDPTKLNAGNAPVVKQAPPAQPGFGTISGGFNGQRAAETIQAPPPPLVKTPEEAARAKAADIYAQEQAALQQKFADQQGAAIADSRARAGFNGGALSGAQSSLEAGINRKFANDETLAETGLDRANRQEELQRLVATGQLTAQQAQLAINQQDANTRQQQGAFGNLASKAALMLYENENKVDVDGDGFLGDPKLQVKAPTAADAAKTAATAADANLVMSGQPIGTGANLIPAARHPEQALGFSHNPNGNDVSNWADMDFFRHGYHYDDTQHAWVK